MKPVLRKNLKSPYYWQRYLGNYIQRTYRIRRRYGFPFNCLTFRDRFR